jgi:hypothetical protein
MSVFAGVFAYRGNSTVAIVPKNATLIAVLDESLYPLKWIKRDEFKNGVGEPVISASGSASAVQLSLARIVNGRMRLVIVVPNASGFGTVGE